MAADETPLGTALDEAAMAVRRRWPERPRMGIVLGSGLGDFAELVETPCSIPFAAIPHHPVTTVEGHAGQVVLGSIEAIPVAVWRGRVHYYEGRSMSEVVFPIRLLHQLGAEAVLLTNAAGGLSDSLVAGDLMLISDHLNLPGLSGHNPLRGPHDAALGERFVDLSAAYDQDLRQLARRVAQRQGFTLSEGIFAMVSGPHYETPAEARLLRQFGADAVGMSTVPEVIAARQLGLKVLAISAITNAILAPTAPTDTTHAQVLAQAERLKPRFSALLRGILSGMREVHRR